MPNRRQMLLGGTIFAFYDPWEVAAQEADVQSVIEAERRFSRDAGELGVSAAFRAHIAPDGILFRPDPMKGVDWLAQQPSLPPRPGGLTWWPIYAGIASSGDLGFTTGPWTSGTRGGYYLTIWRRQPDGTWRFALDHGPVLSPSPISRTAPVEILPPSDVPATQPREGGIAGLFAMDDALAVGAQTDVVSAFSAVLSPDARMMGGAGVGQPAVGIDAWPAELRRRPPRITFLRQGGDISAAGDLAYTYGSAQWTVPDGSRGGGHYVRLWQQRSGRWVLILDEIVEGAPPPPKP